MKFKKRGFSMIEVMVILGFIGFIVITELVILNSKVNEYGNPYYTVYNALKKASYNVLADMYCPDPNSEDEDCKIGPREFPKNSEDLCLRLAEFINTSEKNCSATDLDINDKADNINTNQPRLIASNSYRFYFSDLKKTQATDAYGNVNELEYFVAYVDLNGDKRPNRLTCEGTKLLPDIVPFAITRRGEVIPMGYPVYSKIYLTAKIKYPASVDSDGNMTNRTSASLSYYDAVYGAWPEKGTKNVLRNIDIPFSIMFGEDDIYEDSNIRQCYDGREPELKGEDVYKDEAINREIEGCQGGTYSCRVVIDSSIDKRW